MAGRDFFLALWYDKSYLLGMLLQCQDITKHFGSLVANDRVNFAINRGEIHALLGENGAGKSTLVKIIYGIYKRDGGLIQFNNQPVQFANPVMARKAGICMVFQHFSLIPALSIFENIRLAFDEEPDNLREKIIAKCAEFNFSFNLDLTINQLSVGERQRVEILRCLMQNPKLLIMDEPTSVLTPQEADHLFGILRQLAENGVAILYISHRLEEIRALCHKATIMRAGKVVAEITPKNESVQAIASLMMGNEFVALNKEYKERTGEILLQVHNLSQPCADELGKPLKNINFAVGAGQILGIAGLAGNGQNELFAVLCGEDLCHDAMITYKNSPIGQKPIMSRRKLGFGFAPEERNGHAAVPQLPLWLNGLLSLYANPVTTKMGFINRPFVRQYASDIIAKFKVKTKGIDQEASALSGGNLQKFIVGREISSNPSVIIINQPTWGVDAGAALIIHQAIKDLAQNGAAVVIFSQDLDELYTLADEIAVLCEGELSPAESAQHITREQVGLLMTRGGQ